MVAVITVAGTVEAGSEAEAIKKAAGGIVEEMGADVGSYNGTFEDWLTGKVETAIGRGSVEAFEEDPG